MDEGTVIVPVTKEIGYGPSGLPLPFGVPGLS